MHVAVQAERRDGEDVPEAEQEEPMQPVASLPAKMPSAPPLWARF